jgi:hypothetical protein
MNATRCLGSNIYILLDSTYFEYVEYIKEDDVRIRRGRLASRQILDRCCQKLRARGSFVWANDKRTCERRPHVWRRQCFIKYHDIRLDKREIMFGGWDGCLHVGENNVREVEKSSFVFAPLQSPDVSVTCSRDIHHRRQRPQGKAIWTDQSIPW